MPPTAGNSLDELDIALIRLLADDGRKSYKELGQKLDVSNVTVRNRLNRLIENRSLLIIAWLDPREIGITCGAHVSISVDSPRLNEVAQRVAEFPEVVWLGTSIGEFNIMADIWCLDSERMNEFVAEKLNRIDGVRHLVVNPYVDIHKITTLPNMELLNSAD